MRTVFRCLWIITCAVTQSVVLDIMCCALPSKTKSFEKNWNKDYKDYHTHLNYTKEKKTQCVMDINLNLYFTQNALRTCTTHCAHQRSWNGYPQHIENTQCSGYAQQVGVHNASRAFSWCPQHVVSIASAHKVLRAFISLPKKIQVWVTTQWGGSATCPLHVTRTVLPHIEAHVRKCGFKHTLCFKHMCLKLNTNEVSAGSRNNNVIVLRLKDDRDVSKRSDGKGHTGTRASLFYAFSCDICSRVACVPCNAMLHTHTRRQMGQLRCLLIFTKSSTCA